MGHPSQHRPRVLAPLTALALTLSLWVPAAFAGAAGESTSPATAGDGYPYEHEYVSEDVPLTAHLRYGEDAFEVEVDFFDQVTRLQGERAPGDPGSGDPGNGDPGEPEVPEGWTLEGTVAYPQVQTGMLAPGTQWATRYYVIDSGRPGPVAAIIGGTHGSEVAGWLAARRIVDTHIGAGKLVVVPDANRNAVIARTRGAAGISDFNRLFPRSSTDQPQGTLANSLWDLLKSQGVDWLMDLHEGYNYHRVEPASVGQTIIYYPTSTTRDMATKMINELNQSISLWRYQYQLLSPPVLGSIARGVGLALNARSMIAETAMPQALSTRVAQHRTMVGVLLRELDMEEDPRWEPGRFYRVLGQGEDWATPLYIIRGEEPGPAVLVVGGLHGDKPSGVAAAEKVIDFPVQRGTLLVLPRADRLAVEAGEPFSSVNLNRSFPEASGQEPQGPLAQAIWQVLKDYGVRWVLDLHEGGDYQNVRPGDLGNTIIAAPWGDALGSAGTVAEIVNSRISQTSQHFVVLENPIATGLTRSAADVLGAKAFYVSASRSDSLQSRVNRLVAAVDTVVTRLDMKDDYETWPQPLILEEGEGGVQTPLPAIPLGAPADEYR